MKKSGFVVSGLLALACIAGGVFGADVPKSAAPPLPAMTETGTVGSHVPAFRVQAGFTVTAASDEMAQGQTRFLQFDNFGTLYVSAPKFGTITSFKLQPDGTYKKIADVVTVNPKKVTGLHNMEFVDGWLWYTTSHGVFKGKVVADGSKLDEITTILPEGSVPGGGGHWWRAILVTPDGFYTGMGDHDNFSDLNNTKVLAKQEQTEPHAFERQKIWKYSLDGKTKTLFSAGNRNTEKLLFRPGTDEVWGLDQASDNWGLLLGDDIGKNQPITDNIPGEEVNHYVQGKFYGHPFVADNNFIRPEYANLSENKDIVPNPVPAEYPDIKAIQANAEKPAYLFPPHFSVCGWIFLDKDNGLGKRGDIYVACHGSWDREIKVGYCIAHLVFENGKPTQAYKIVNTMENDSIGRTDKVGVLGRPVDVAQEPGTDNLIFSVDEPHGRLYRLSRISGK